MYRQRSWQNKRHRLAIIAAVCFFFSNFSYLLASGRLLAENEPNFVLRFLELLLPWIISVAFSITLLIGKKTAVLAVESVNLLYYGYFVLRYQFHIWDVVDFLLYVLIFSYIFLCSREGEHKKKPHFLAIAWVIPFLVFCRHAVGILLEYQSGAFFHISHMWLHLLEETVGAVAVLFFCLWASFVAEE